MAIVKYNDRSIKDLTTAPAAVPSSPGALVHIKTLTASSSSTLSFVNGADSVVLDSTYPIYKFEFINIHPQTDSVSFQFNLSVDTGSNYNVAKTTTNFRAYNIENDSDRGLGYRTGSDLAQGTGFLSLSNIEVGNDNDQCAVATLELFNPSSTTFVKHFLAISNTYQKDDFTMQHFIGGYGNTTSAVDAVQFKFSSGDIDAGTIKMYGIV